VRSDDEATAFATDACVEPSDPEWASGRPKTDTAGKAKAAAVPAAKQVTSVASVRRRPRPLPLSTLRPPSEPIGLAGAMLINPQSFHSLAAVSGADPPIRACGLAFPARLPVHCMFMAWHDETRGAVRSEWERTGGQELRTWPESAPG
jgi:hypothetical protein